MFQFSFQFAEALAQAGHRVRLISGPRPELRSTEPNLEVVESLPTWHPNAAEPGGSLRRKVRRASRALLLLESWRRVLLDLRRHRPDIVQFGELRYILDTAALLAVVRWGRAGAVVDVAHNPLPYDVNSRSQSVEKGGRLTRWFLNKAYAACDLILVLGDGPKADLETNFSRLPSIAVCGHGDYSSVLDPSELPRPSDAPPRALLFGAWTKYKNIPLLLDAFALVRQHLPDAGLTLAGPVMPDVDLDAITRHADEIGAVDLRPGYVPMEALAGLFGEHRVVMFTYETVNISGSVHMAYTFGRPVVATRVGSMCNSVRDGVTGLLVEPHVTAVAEAMVEVLSDPVKADRMGAAALTQSRSGSSWSAVAGRAASAYERVLATGN